MNIIDMVAYENDGKLSRIKEAQLAYNYVDLYSNVIKSSLGMFLIDLSRSAIKEREANLDIYNLIVNYLMGIDQNKLEQKYLPIQFSIDLAAYLGFQLSDNYSPDKEFFDLMSGQFINNDIRSPYCLNIDLSKYLSQILSHENVEMNKSDRNELVDSMIKYYQLHIEGFKPLKSLSVLRTILS